jgi:hypothetical protein
MKRKKRKAVIKGIFIYFLILGLLLSMLIPAVTLFY